MDVTLVSCYYRLKQSKHRLHEYSEWIKNFILNLNNTNLVIFTSQKDYAYIQSMMQNENIQYKIFIREIDDFNISKVYPLIWDTHASMDPTPSCGRGIDCYKIWNSKFELLKHAIVENPFHTDYFVWNDMGNVRQENIIPYLSSYPSSKKISRDKLDIILLNGFREPKTFYQNEVHFSGSMFGSHKDVLLELHELFYRYFDLYVKNGYFIGCDQQIISTLFIRHPEKINPIFPMDCHVDPWFYLYEYYS
jgi:hypothetical protein